MKCLVLVDIQNDFLPGGALAVPEGDAVTVLDAATQETLNAVRLNLGDLPRDLALTPDGKTLLIVNEGSHTVSVVDTMLLLETARIPG